MPSPSDNPAVVILDVLNLRRFRSDEKREPFSIEHFDSYVAAIRQRLPNVITIGIVDGTAAKFKSRVFASSDDHAELIRRSNLTPVDLQHLHLLPKRHDKWGWGTDLRYIKADPVCVHLLSKFPENGAIVSGDQFYKTEDFAWFPPDHELRANLFVPFWLRRPREWIFLAGAQVRQKWDYRFFKDAEDGKFLQLEQFLNSPPISEDEFASVRQQAYGYIHDVVNEHRAAGTRVVPIVLDWQKSTVGGDLDPRDFPDAPDAPIEIVHEELIDVGVSIDSDVLVRVATEPIDLIRSIDELNVYVGRRVRLHAMLRFAGDVPYLVWFGLATRVRVSLEGPSYPLTSGLVRVEGMLSESGGELNISVSSARDIRQQSIVDVISGRITRLVQGDLFAGERGAWGFPALPRRRAPQVSPPPPPPLSKPVATGSSGHENRGQIPSEPSVPVARKSSNGGDTSSGRGVGHSASGARTIAKTTSQAAGFKLPKTPTILKANKRSRKLVAVAVVVTVAVAIAVTVALGTFVFAFESPEPAVCINAEPAVCEVIVAEWRGDAIRVNLYGTRGPDGLVS